MPTTHIRVEVDPNGLIHLRAYDDDGSCIGVFPEMTPSAAASLGRNLIRAAERQIKGAEDEDKRA